MPYVSEADRDNLVSQEDITNFKMPRPYVGQQVRWYSTGRSDPSRVNAAIVTRIVDKSIDVSVILGMAKFAVRHVGDPRLKMNEDMRREGAWDFTEEFYQNLARWSEFEVRLTRLEEKYEEQNGEQRGGGSGMDELWKLRRACKDLAGDKQWGKLSRKECEDLLANAPGA